ncbi:MAG: hypothetical protein KTR32_35695 [Granulosicoccus sp.]|nr:hypothetical protein [Granulosicoccus sp.]
MPFATQIDDLTSDRHIVCTGPFITLDELRFDSQYAVDGNALALAA